MEQCLAVCLRRGKKPLKEETEDRHETEENSDKFYKIYSCSQIC